MKGFFRWFKSSTKMKRWMLLVIIGIVLACYGIAEILTGKTLSFFDIGKIVLVFVLGFIFIIIGMVRMQRRTLELFIQETDVRIDNAKTGDNVSSLIYNKKIFDQGPKIVAIGGGTGLNSVLRGLKNYTDNITAIVTVSDYGEVETDSRRKLGVMPLNDIKESLVALARNEEAMEELLNLKIKEERLRDLSFGDIYFTAMNELCGDFTTSIEQSKEILNMTGRVLPVTLEPITICAELEDGTVIENKNKIPEIVQSKTSKISRIYIRPTTCKPAPGVIDAIKEADAIVIGPGSLYTNVIPNLLVKGVSKAIKESRAFKIYVSNIMTEPGQTDDYSLADHIKAINDHAGKGVIEYCIYDTGELIPEFIRKYNMQGQELLTIDSSVAKAQGVNLMQREISYITGEYIRHNPDAVAASIIQLICDDLKFKDMQNDAKYVLLNDKLKDAKKSLKEASKENRMNRQEEIKISGESKFFKKYKDRIESIQEAEIKMKVKQGIPLEEIQRKAKSETLKSKKSNKASSKSAGSKASSRSKSQTGARNQNSGRQTSREKSVQGTSSARRSARGETVEASNISARRTTVERQENVARKTSTTSKTESVSRRSNIGKAQEDTISKRTNGSKQNMAERKTATTQRRQETSTRSTKGSKQSSSKGNFKNNLFNFGSKYKSKH